MKLKHTGGEWKVRKTVDESGDYPFPTYDIIALFEYGPQGIGTADQQPYNALLFAASPKLLAALIELHKWQQHTQIYIPGIDTLNLIEEASGMTIEEILK